MRWLLAVVVLPALVAVGLVGFAGTQRAMAAPLAGQGGCILGIICIPGSPSPTPSPTPTSVPASTPASTATPTPTPTPSKQCVLGVVCLPNSSSPASLPSGTAPVGAGLLPTANPSASATSSNAAQKRAAATPGLVAASATAVLTAGTANITGFHYVGNVDVPTAGGTQTMMKFTADSIDLSGTVTVTVTQDGQTVTTVSASQDFSNGVTLYATQLSGSLQAVPGLPGVPLTLSPSTISVANLLKLPNVGELQLANLITGAIPLTMTGVTTDQLLISGGTQVTTQLSMS